MCNLIKRLIRATFLSTHASDVHERHENKRHGQAIKIARETTNNQYRATIFIHEDMYFNTCLRETL